MARSNIIVSSSSGTANSPTFASTKEITLSVVSTEVSSVESDGSVTLEVIETDQQIIFQSVDSQDELINQIDNNYENSPQRTPDSGLGISLYAAPDTTWGTSTEVCDIN